MFECFFVSLNCSSEIWSALEKHFYEQQSTTTGNPNLGWLGDDGGVVPPVLFHENINTPVMVKSGCGHLPKSVGPSSGQKVSSGRPTMAYGAAMSRSLIAHRGMKTTSPTDLDTRNDGDVEGNESCGSRAVESLKLEVYKDVLALLYAMRHEDTSQPAFEDQLWIHLNRLPPKYALFVKVNWNSNGVGGQWLAACTAYGSTGGGCNAIHSGGLGERNPNFDFNLGGAGSYHNPGHNPRGFSLRHYLGQSFGLNVRSDLDITCRADLLSRGSTHRRTILYSSLSEPSGSLYTSVVFSRVSSITFFRLP
ncbi:hypothetical protein L1987_11870 [Smallanthus sonchifolius]|uniref:Uncharacterized protein n=1 Tax=Smallanthus sonchifolius TaxID=185202 RepID=A0ACB9JDR2_9ASTR|nr:hypothetical protein L1987_11870 [Smallanthus sonchifolius]